MNQGGRQLIQQVGIVDTDDRMIPGEEGFPSGGQKGDRLWWGRRANERGKHAQRDAAR
jgi:hypothetical protein